LSEFQNLFDQYRLSKVIVIIDIPAGVFNSVPNSLCMPQMHYVVDYDDSADAQINDLLQYPQDRIHNFYKDGYTPFILEFSPKPLRDVAGSGLSTTYGPMSTAPWLRTVDMSTPHYGLKLAFDYFGLPQTTDIPLVMTIWYNMEFTNPK